MTMIRKIDHVGVAVSSLEEHIPFYRDILGLELVGTEEVPEQKVRVAMFQVGEVKIELLEPLSEESPIAKFIEKKGEGIHHLAYDTDDIEDELSVMKGKGVRLIDEEPRSGAHGSRIAFLHPKSSAKVLTELCQAGEE
ncbi:MAG TPA: methylmalonyl-CoA epimerase [Candidatus Mcinerneyibacteriales bacterium]|nr:methylmalonyl-CoA epimerase [Candidatus Mcinerneyibacteriales bacterium]HPE20365.1 methylmalonyl-CoA epimerase [Candidatus Mcinerneyibacteriales bacterium]HPJ69583.1 methylmalonyl-CoA epimerase [Candidatus Mcinerneyibacteriales bacterium]